MACRKSSRLPCLTLASLIPVGLLFVILAVVRVRDPAPLPWADEDEDEGNDNGCNRLATVADGGRLGNLMSQYATLFANAGRLKVPFYYSHPPDVHRLKTPSSLQLRPVISPRMESALRRHFPSLSMMSGGVCAGAAFTLIAHENVSRADSLADLHLAADGGNVRIGGYPNDVRRVAAVRDDILAEFRFGAAVRARAQAFLRSVAAKATKRRRMRDGPNNNGSSDVVFVGVHVRRTDYAEWTKARLGGVLVTARYFAAAMDAFRGRFGDAVAFVVASDDLGWCHRFLAGLDGVHFVEWGRAVAAAAAPAQDMAVLAACNHSIIRSVLVYILRKTYPFL